MSLAHSPINGLTPEQTSLLKAATEAWELHGNSKLYNSPLGEETITELILLKLKMGYPSNNISILSFNKHQEGKSGADWAWAFRSANGKYSMPMLVQAKILNNSENSYNEIKRKIGKSGVRQIDKLIQHAVKKGWPAIYAFYNHFNNTSAIPHGCSTLTRNGVLLPESWGISFADACVVKSKLDATMPEDQSFSTHAQHSLPLHCLLCSRGTGTRDEEGSAGLALEALRHMRLRGTRDGDSIANARDDISALPDEPYSELPDIFAKALRILDQDSPNARTDSITQLSEQYPDIAGVVVLTDTE